MPNNPFLLPPQDPFEAYRDNRDKLQAEQDEFDRLAFEVLIANPSGQKLCEMIHKHFIVPTHFSPDHPHADHLALWWDGFKEACRGLIKKGLNHQKRMAGA